MSHLPVHYPSNTDLMKSGESYPPCEVQGGYLPTYSYPGDAGADLRAASDVMIPAEGQAMVSTGLKLALPEGYVGLIWPRSGLAVKQGLDTGAGVVDSSYRGEIKVLLFNHSHLARTLKKGDRVAQILVQKVETVQFIQVDQLEDTRRGDSGFGSTGVGSP